MIIFLATTQTQILEMGRHLRTLDSDTYGYSRIRKILLANDSRVSTTIWSGILVGLFSLQKFRKTHHISAPGGPIFQKFGTLLI